MNILNYSENMLTVSGHRRNSRISSSSSGSLSDGGAGSETNIYGEFPIETIKRKPHMKPNIPLTTITRQVKEIGEKADEEEAVEGDTLARKALKRHPSTTGTTKRTTCAKPNIPLTFMTRHLKERFEKEGHEEVGDEYTNTFRPHCTRADETFQRQYTTDCAEIGAHGSEVKIMFE